MQLKYYDCEKILLKNIRLLTSCNQFDPLILFSEYDTKLKASLVSHYAKSFYEYQERTKQDKISGINPVLKYYITSFLNQKEINALKQTSKKMREIFTIYKPSVKKLFPKQKLVLQNKISKIKVQNSSYLNLNRILNALSSMHLNLNKKSPLIPRIKNLRNDINIILKMMEKCKVSPEGAAVETKRKKEAESIESSIMDSAFVLNSDNSNEELKQKNEFQILSALTPMLGYEHPLKKYKQLVPLSFSLENDLSAFPFDFIVVKV